MMKAWITTVLMILATVSAARAADNMAAFPPAEEGMIRYVLQLGLLALPKTANPVHMKDNADVDFAISEEDMERLKNMERIKDYGEASVFPVYQ